MPARAWLFAVMLSACAWTSAESGYPSRPDAVQASDVLVTPDMSVGHVCQVVDVLDFHAPARSEDKGFAALRAKAAELGADAVIGAEFEHGEDGGLSHLSGIAVRYVAVDDRPFDVLGEIDIATPEDDEDKGLDQLRARARAMGADGIRNIHFEHGEEGGESHLRGVAVLHRAP